VILDTNGNIFGGFTPVEWESRVWNEKGGNEDNRFKADDSQKSFLFTLKNPHNIPARRFALKAERKDWAIVCHSQYGPDFRDIAVSDNCNANTHSETSLGQVTSKRPLVHRGAVRADTDRLVPDPEPLLHAPEHGPQLVPGLADRFDLLQREDDGLR
jgi:hypothetical protein